MKVYLVLLSMLLAPPIGRPQMASAAGTLLEAIGNQNGIVVMTDSRMTRSATPGSITASS